VKCNLEEEFNDDSSNSCKTFIDHIYIIRSIGTQINIFQQNLKLKLKISFEINCYCNQ